MWNEIFEDPAYVDILAALYYVGEATAFDLSKITKHKAATISRKLQELVKMGVLSEPVEDTSRGRLRKIYYAPSSEFYDRFKFFLHERVQETQKDKLTQFMLEQLTYIFDLPHQKERDILEILEEYKQPTVILLGELNGWWKFEEDRLIVTDEAIEYLENLYAYWIERYWVELKKLNSKKAERLLGEIIERHPP